MRRLPFLFMAVALASCGPEQPVTPPKTVIFFPHASVRLDAPAQRLVELAASQAHAQPTASVTVEGYAAANGDLDADAQLAAQRAQVVAHLLVADGVDPSRLQVIPRPPSNEISKSVGARRVEIVIGN